MSWRRDRPDGPRYVVLPQDEVEEGAARATARAVLREIGAQKERGEEPDLVAALEKVADRETADELMDRWEELRYRHSELARERKRAVEQHNRAMETLEKYDREGIMTAEHRQEYEDAEQVIEEQAAEIDRLNAEIGDVRDEMTQIGRRIDREYQSVVVLPSSPSLNLPDDPRITQQE